MERNGNRSGTEVAEKERPGDVGGGTGAKGGSHVSSEQKTQ